MGVTAVQQNTDKELGVNLRSEDDAGADLTVRPVVPPQEHLELDSAL